MAPVTAGVLACTGMAVLLLARATRRPDQIGLHSAWTGYALAAVPAGSGYLGFAGYVVSGEIEARLALDGVAGGPFSLLRKPVRADELAVRIGVVLTQKERARLPGDIVE